MCLHKWNMGGLYWKMHFNKKWPKLHSFFSIYFIDVYSLATKKYWAFQVHSPLRYKYPPKSWRTEPEKYKKILVW